MAKKFSLSITLPTVRREGLYVGLLILAIILFCGYTVYSINSFNRYVDSFAYSSYYNNEELREYFFERIDIELRGAVEEKIESDELAAIISFNKSASRSEFFVNVFGVISIVFLGLLAFNAVVGYRRSRTILRNMKRTQNKGRGVLEEQRGVLEETKTILSDMKILKYKELVTGVKYRPTAKPIPYYARRLLKKNGTNNRTK